MNASNLFCSVLCLLLVVSVVPASAQMRDQETATPRMLAGLLAAAEPPASAAAGPAATGRTAAQSELLLHDLTAALQLQPHQVLAVRRALAAGATPAAAVGGTTVPAQNLHGRLTETQLARLQQWEAALPYAERANLVATLR